MTRLRPIPRVNILQSSALSGRTGNSNQEKQLFKFLSLNSHELLEARLTLAKWLLEHKPLKSISFGTAAMESPNAVWKYWDSSPTHWSDIVRACNSSHEFYFSQDLIPLNDENLVEYLVIPDWINEKRKVFSKTFFSDLLRLLLLKTYGGTWLDSTVLLTAKPVRLSGDEKFFAYTRPSDPFMLSSWFLSATSDSYIVRKLLEVILAYWRDFDEQSHYFDFHFAFEILYFTDPKFRKEWQKARCSSHVAPHLLQGQLAEKFSEHKLKLMFDSSDVHKLTYKLAREVINDSSNFYNLLVSSQKLYPTTDENLSIGDSAC
jgi:hypothetical protein